MTGLRESLAGGTKTNTPNFYGHRRNLYSLFENSYHATIHEILIIILASGLHQ